MKNSEKYKTLQEREEAFAKVCTSCEDCVLGKVKWRDDGAIKAFEAMCFNRKCADCQYSPNNNPYHCEIRWLYDEAEEDDNEK